MPRFPSRTLFVRWTLFRSRNFPHTRQLVNTLTGLTPTKLQLVAEHADKLLRISESDKPRKDFPEESATSAANELLSVSTDPTSTLRDTIAQPGSKLVQSQVGILHRAFLVSTNRCLEELQSRLLASSSKTNSFQELHRDTIIDELLSVSMKLAQHAHRLGLPLHIPLAQQLMETYILSKRPQGVEHVLEIASYTDTPRSAALLRPALLAFVHSNDFDEAALFMNHVPDLLWDRTTCIEVYRYLHYFLRDKKIRYVSENLPLLQQSTVAMQTIISRLELSVLQVFPEAGDDPWEEERAEVDDLVDDLADEEWRDREHYESHEDDLDASTRPDHSYLDAPTQPDLSDISDDEEATPDIIDPVDIAISILLTRRMQSHEARMILATYIEKRDRYKKPPRRSWAARDYEYNSRQQFHSFPDVTSQIIELGELLQFTPEYQDYLIKLESDADELESMSDDSSEFDSDDNDTDGFDSDDFDSDDNSEFDLDDKDDFDSDEDDSDGDL